MSDAELVMRVERLERENRRLRWFGVAAFAVVAALATIYATRPAPQKITAREFDLVDSAGRVRGEMGFGPSGESGIELYDAQGKERADMGLGPSGTPVIGLSDAQGKRRAGMGLLPSGEPVIKLSDAQGKERAIMWVLPSGAPVIDLYDAQGKERAIMLVAASGEPVIELNDSQGFSMDLGSTNTVMERAGETQHASADSIVMFGNGKRHRVIWQAP